MQLHTTVAADEACRPVSRMRAKGLLLVLLIAASAALVVAGALTHARAAISTAPTGQKTWYWQNPLPQGNLLYGVDAPPGSHVWAVGGPGIVLHSNDGGAQWDAQDSNTQVILRAVDFVDGSVGYVAGDTNTIRKTTDGGSTWVTQTVTGTSRNFYGASMATSQTGWVCGTSGTIRKTSDGGSSWVLQTANAGTNALNAISAVDDTRVWAVGAAGTIVRTVNGSSWTTQTSGVALALNGVDFVDTQTGYVVGNTGTVLKTTNGGSTWTTLTVTYLSATSVPTTLTTTMRAVSFRDASTGWIAGDTGLVLFTQDGGVSWTSQKSGAQAMYGVAAAEGSKGHLVGANGVMLRTVTNGLVWQGQQQGTTSRLNGASWTGPTSGIVVGAGGLVMKTEDAGDSWASQTLGANDLYGVKFLGSTDGWVVGSGGFIRKTTDAGETWAPQTSGTTQILYSVTAVTTQTAWAVGAAGTILKTVDGGATWTPKVSGTANVLYDVFFLDANTGWTVGAAGTVRKTVDGGETWAAQTSGVTSTIYSVHFTDANNGWYTSTTGRLRRTTNGGTTWVAQTTGTTLALYSVEMADSNVGWAVGGAATGSVVLRTINGGTTWTAQDGAFTGALRQVTVATTSVAGIVGDGGAMRRTFDAGATWEPTGFWSVSNYRDLSFASDDEGWSVGDGGVVAHTHDGGYTWAAQQSGTTSNLNSVDFVSEDKGWAVGAAGVIRTTVTHTTWTGQTSGVTVALNGVDFVDLNTGWAVGAAGTVLKTVNGGSTWATQTSGVPTTTILYGISALDTQTAFAWGAAGTIAKTTDGGSSWTTGTVSASIPILYAGSFVDSQTGWVAGASGQVLKTTDAGSVWTTQTANAGTNALYALHFRDSLNGYLVGAAGTVRRTSDGGTNWITQLPGTSNILYSVVFTDADHGWLVGVGGTILRTTDNAPPVTTLVVDPPAPNGHDNWYRGSPQISFVSNEPGLTYYSWTSATGPWTSYSVPIVPPHDGEQTIYWYSIDPGGNKEMVQSMTGKVDATPPSTPGTPTAVPASTTNVDLSWAGSSDAASGMDYYEVLVDGSLATSTTATNVTVSGLATETAYTVTVRAYDVAGNPSSESATATAVTLPAYPRPPLAVFARALGGYGALVNWSESTGTVSPVQYRVWRSDAGAAFSAIETVTSGDPRSYADISAPLGVQLRYSISTVDSRGEGPMSAPAAMSTTTSTVLPAPSGIRVTNTHSVLVTWTPIPGADGYHVYRSTTSAGAPETRTVSPVSSASYEDSTTPYTEYWYRIAAVDTSGVVGLRSAPSYIRTEGTSTVPAPHGAYTTDTDMCALCHAAHTATSPISLLKGTDNIDAPLCFSCHDGTSAPDVLTEYLDESRTSRHSVPIGMVPGDMSCAQCHGVHSSEQTDTVKGLLLAGGSKSGNDYCYECHGDASGANARGDLRGFEQSAHSTGVPEPVTGTKVVCLSCHIAHTSSEPSLYPYANDDRCMNCHSAGGLASAKTNIAERLSGLGSDTRHDLRSADTSENGSRLACGNCHEPHTSSATTPCVDPDNPRTTGGMATGVALCLRCHDGVLPTSVETSGWVAAPLAAGGATTTVDIGATWDSTSVHGAGASVSPSLRTDMGFSAGDSLTCANCHDSHGSTNRFTLLESVRAKTGTFTVDSLMVFPMPSGGADLRFFCASCHDFSPATHPDVASGGADLTVWPLDCTTSGCHNHSGNGL